MGKNLLSNMNSKTNSILPPAKGLVSSDSPAPIRTPVASSISMYKSRLPFRLGITWAEGTKLEAMDFQMKWFTAKIMEVNRKDHSILIHFDGWNSRYDEWLPMTSERIRPLARQSLRRVNAGKGKLLYKVNDCILAKWSDCRMYAARIIKCNPSGTYFVQFYDGVCKTVQDINVKPMSADLQQQLAKQNLLPRSINRRLASQNSYIEKLENKYEDLPQDTEPRCKLQRQVEKRSPLKDGKGILLEGKTSLGRTVKDRASDGKFSKLSPGESSKDNLRPFVEKATQSSANKVCKQKPSLVKLAKVKRRIGKVSRGNFSAKFTTSVKGSIPASKELCDQAASEDTSSSKSGNNSASSSSKSNTPQVSPGILTDEVNIAQFAEQLQTMKPVGNLAPKAFIIESDHNPFKCQHEGCSKSFRKQSLLDSHIKYYHQPAIATVKKRRKNNSSCSTDSDLSVGGFAGKKKRDYLLESAENFPSSGDGTCIPPAGSNPSIDLRDESEELIHCKCGRDEEQGKMLQCSVCLCWQHSACTLGDPELIPSQYVCWVCCNPPGIRTASRYSYDQRWYKKGKLATLKFLPKRSDQAQYEAMNRQMHELTTELHHFHEMFISLRHHISLMSQVDSCEKLKKWCLHVQDMLRPPDVLSAPSNKVSFKEEITSNNVQWMDKLPTVVNFTVDHPNLQIFENTVEMNNAECTTLIPHLESVHSQFPKPHEINGNCSKDVLGEQDCVFGEDLEIVKEEIFESLEKVPESETVKLTTEASLSAKQSSVELSNEETVLHETMKWAGKLEDEISNRMSKIEDKISQIENFSDVDVSTEKLILRRRIQQAFHDLNIVHKLSQFYQ